MPVLSIRFISTLLASLLLHLTFGTVYCWGNLAPYVVSYLRLRGYKVDYGEMSWAVSLTTAMQAVTMIAGGFLHTRVGMCRVAGIGSYLATLGIFLSSYAIEYGKMYFLLFYSVTFGMGVGFAYVVPMLVLMKWLPDNKGFASGIVVAGFGAGACIFNKVQEEYINPHHIRPLLEVEGQKFFDWQDQDTVLQVLRHVPALLRAQSAIFAVMQCVGLLLLFEPPQTEDEGEVEWERSIESLESSPNRRERTSRKAVEQGLSRRVEQATEAPLDMTPQQMVRTTHFWILIGNVFCCAQVVLMMAASQKTLGLVLLPGVSDDTLTNLSGLASLLNALGRLLWGTIGDLTSYRCAIMAACSVLAVLLGTLPFLATNVFRYGVWLAAVFCCIGGFFALFPLATSTLFGPKNMGCNYGVVFLGVAVSELLGSLALQCVLARRPIAVTCETLAVLSCCSILLASQLMPAERNQAGEKLVEASFTKTKVTYGGTSHMSKAK